jgi:hypothetical protein
MAENPFSFLANSPQEDLCLLPKIWEKLCTELGAGKVTDEALVFAARVEYGWNKLYSQEVLRRLREARAMLADQEDNEA